MLQDDTFTKSEIKITCKLAEDNACRFKNENPKVELRDVFHKQENI